MAQARGYCYVHQGAAKGGGEFAAAWGFPKSSSGLLIPLHGVLNPDAVQLRLDPDANSPDGAKFRTPKGQRNTLATSPLTSHLLPQTTQLLVIAEGVTRVDALAAFGIPAVGMTGIWNWRSLTVLPDFESIAIKGQRIIIAPDGDVRIKPLVKKAVDRLAAWLRAKGADGVHILALPDGQGLDDWIAQQAFDDPVALVHAMREHVTERVALEPPIPPMIGDTFEVDDAGPWARTPAADVRRLLEYSPDKLCVVRVQDGPWRLLVAQAGGRWAAEESVVGEEHIDCALAWQRSVTKAAARGELTPLDAQTCTRWAVSSAKPAGLREMLGMVGVMYLHMKTHGILPDGLTFCEEEALDADRFTMGARNGVIDLNTGRLLPPDVARSRFVTRSIPDPFNPGASHSHATDLIRHLDDQDRDYLEHALGYALRGNPARRVYGLAGPKGGGKSTLLAAIVAALGNVKGNGYGMRLDVEALLATRWTSGRSGHHGNLVGLQDARVVVTEEPPDGRRFNGALLKDLTGGTPQAFRDVGEKAPAARAVKGTLFIAMNPGQEATLDTTDDALADRVRLLPYPALPAYSAGKADVERLTQVAENPDVRQAVMAMLVRWGTLATTRPADSPSVADFTAQRRRDSIGAVGQFLQDRLRVTERYGDSVNTEALWQTLVEELGPEDAHGRLEGLDRKGMTALARELHPTLPRVQPTRRGSVWKGVQLVAAEDPDDGDLGECANCGKPITPIEGVDPMVDGKALHQNCRPPVAGSGAKDTAPQPQQPQLQAMLGHEITVLSERARREEGVIVQLRGLYRLRKAAPDSVILPRHIVALGGGNAALAIIRFASDLAARAVDEDAADSIDWERELLGIRRKAEQMEQQTNEERQQQLSEALKERLNAALRLELWPGASQAPQPDLAEGV